MSANLTLNVVSILVGILIVRIMFVWYGCCKSYIESHVEIDPQECRRDTELAKREGVGAITVTAVTGFIIIVIISYYSSRY